jgi:hypothetical protein
MTSQYNDKKVQSLIHFAGAGEANVINHNADKFVSALYFLNIAKYQCIADTQYSIIFIETKTNERETGF